MHNLPPLTYEATQYTTDPVSLRLVHPGQRITLERPHRFCNGNLSVQTSEVVDGQHIWSTSRYWKPKDPQSQ